MPETTPATRPPARARRGMEPERRRLLLAAGMALLGGFLPWIYTALGNVSGARGAGLWVAYAAVLGLAGALTPWRQVTAVQAGILALVALVLPVWQVVHLLTMVGTQGWLPGPGLLMCAGAGVLAGSSAVRLLRPPVVTR